MQPTPVKGTGLIESKAGDFGHLTFSLLANCYRKVVPTIPRSGPMQALGTDYMDFLTRRLPRPQSPAAVTPACSTTDQRPVGMPCFSANSMSKGRAVVC